MKLNHVTKARQQVHGRLKRASELARYQHLRAMGDLYLGPMRYSRRGPGLTLLNTIS
jgi:hypothetical protein